LKKELIIPKHGYPNDNNAAQNFGIAKASTFQVITKCKASSLDAIRRKTNYF
jgi:hypothetical protein